MVLSPWGERKSKHSPLPGERVPEVRGQVRGHFDRWPSFGSRRWYTPPMRVPTHRVRELRRNQTEAEKAAWYLLRNRRLGAKFHRQCRIENWIVRFMYFGSLNVALTVKSHYVIASVFQ